MNSVSAWFRLDARVQPRFFLTQAFILAIGTSTSESRTNSGFNSVSNIGIAATSDGNPIGNHESNLALQFQFTQSHQLTAVTPAQSRPLVPVAVKC